jgi:hypothetical protein
MSDTTREVEELQQDEQTHAIIMSGGVLIGDFIKPYATNMEHRILTMYPTSHSVFMGLSSPLKRSEMKGILGNPRPGIIYNTSTKIICKIVFSPVKSRCPRKFRLFK